uniref:Secreted protein n=1 Tax=Schistocephalus solidus TaxID=70667 RepID=A0A183SI64_SCHSO
LVLTACASEDFEGGGLDDISQLAPSCFHGAVIIWRMQVLKRSALFSLSKKRRESFSSLTENKSSGGMITRLRSSALLTYEVMKRAVRRRSQTTLSSCGGGGRLPHQLTDVEPTAAATDDERLSF